MTNSPPDTDLRNRPGDPGEWLSRVYEELRDLARGHMRHEAGVTLQTTVLVHEAYLRLFGGKAPTWENRAHFFGAAANCMRQILIDHARSRQALKRGGGRRPLPLDDADVEAPADDDLRLLSLHAALDLLEKRDPRKAQIVMLRYFAGLTIEQTAEVLDLSATTVKDQWQFARAWLFHEMTREQRDESMG
ncbi:MAG: sigma-70 family RNA polymerase sigma factor [Phycisphaeraceae bacterium]|nr:sigma-70 family RNA polymerase sigma factor [Phycisphaeraceae bacterium]